MELCYTLSELEHIVCRNDEGNQMSLTMLLRRSPDLDVETLGRMNLVSSSTVKGPEEVQSNEEPPEHVVSNDHHPYPKVTQSQQIHLKPVPRPRQAVFPHAIHLKDFAPVPWHDGLHLSETASSATADAESEQLKTQQAPLWHSALHAGHENSTAADPAVPSSSAKGGVQAAAAAHTPKKKAYVHMCRWYPHVNARDAHAPFDLYQPSSKLVLERSKQSVLQTQTAVASSKPSVAGLSSSESADSNAAVMGSQPEVQSLTTREASSPSADAVIDDTAYPMGPDDLVSMQNSADAAVSANESAADSALNPASEPPAKALGYPGSEEVAESAIEGPCETAAELAVVSAAHAGSAAAAELAVDSADESAEAAYDNTQGSYSVQEPALDSDSLLPHKSSSVRFLVALDSMTSSEATANSAAVSPEPVCNMDSIPETLTEASREEGVATQAANSKHAMRTVSSASAASLKSSLKSAHSSLSNAGSQRGTHGSLQLGVNFAAQRDEGDDDGKAAEPSTVKSGIVRGASDAFPAWLTEGYLPDASNKQLARYS